MTKVLLEALSNVNPNMLEGLDHIQFGVEFEFILHPQKLKTFLFKNNLAAAKNIDETYAINAANKILNKIGLPNWDAKYDSSIESEDEEHNNFGVEVVTPPLKGADGLNEIIKFCTVFSKIGYVNDTCGLHVHVDANDWINKNLSNKEKTERITTLLLKFKTFENLFDAQVAAWRRKNRADYARSPGTEEQILNAYKNVINSEYFNEYDLSDIVKTLSDSRYRKLNTHSLLKYGTIEFRQLEGTLNSDKVVRWVLLCLSFLENTKKITNAYQDILSKISTQTKLTTDFSKVTPPSVSPQILARPTAEDVKPVAQKLSKYISSEKDIDNLVVHIINTTYKRSFIPGNSLELLKGMCEKIINQTAIQLPSIRVEEAKKWLKTYTEQGQEGIVYHYLLSSFGQNLWTNLTFTKNVPKSIFIPGYELIYPTGILLAYNKIEPGWDDKPQYQSIYNAIHASNQKLQIALEHAMFNVKNDRGQIILNIVPTWYYLLSKIMQDKTNKELSRKMSAIHGGKPDFKQVVPTAAQPFVLKQKG